MSTALDLVYQYRRLAGKRGHSGLTMDEIDVMTTIEALFRDHHDEATPRRFARAEVALPASLRGRGHVDPVRIDNLAPGGLVCARVPYLERDDLVEVVIDDAECALSYRFKARVSWTRQDARSGDFTAGLRFVGQPVLLRYARCERASVADAA